MQPQDRPVTVNASGVVRSADALRFGPPPSQSWRITITKLAREGSRAKAGDVLAQFDASATDDRVRTLNAELNAKRSALESLFETLAREIEQEKVRLAESKSEAEKAARKVDTDAELYASLEYKKLLEENAIAQDLYRREQQRPPWSKPSEKPNARNWKLIFAAWSLLVILIAVLVCVAIAVGFGVYPAVSAARLNPVLALQSD